MKSVNELCELIVNDGQTDDQPNHNENTVHRFHCPAERYLVDFATDFSAEQWEQYDTDQDAHYFGVWINKHSLRILTYAEGDWTLVACLDVDQFNREIGDMNEFYGEGRIAVAYDDQWTRTEYRQNREQFLTGKEQA